MDTFDHIWRELSGGCQNCVYYIHGDLTGSVLHRHVQHSTFKRLKQHIVLSTIKLLLSTSTFLAASRETCQPSTIGGDARLGPTYLIKKHELYTVFAVKQQLKRGNNVIVVRVIKSCICPRNRIPLQARFN